MLNNSISSPLEGALQANKKICLTLPKAYTPKKIFCLTYLRSIC